MSPVVLCIGVLDYIPSSRSLLTSIYPYLLISLSPIHSNLFPYLLTSLSPLPMKSNRSVTTRSLSTILIGTLIIVFPFEATTYMVMAIGALFLFPGVISIANYMQKRKIDDSTKAVPRAFFPIVGIGSVLFGAILLGFASHFTEVLMYMLAAFIVLGGLAQLFHLVRLRKVHSIGGVPYVVSGLITAAGLVIGYMNYRNINTLDGAERLEAMYTTSIVFGVTSIVYGIVELVYAINFRHPAVYIVSDSSITASDPSTTIGELSAKESTGIASADEANQA